MFMGHRVKQTASLKDRLALFAEETREKASRNWGGRRPGAGRRRTLSDSDSRTRYENDPVYRAYRLALAARSRQRKREIQDCLHQNDRTSNHGQDGIPPPFQSEVRPDVGATLAAG
jgi:hypothetical protein